MRGIRNKIKQKSGATLIELLISFALLALFMTAAIAIITPATGIFQRVKSLSYAQSVADMVMDKVGGELSAATDKVVISGDKSGIQFMDSHGSPVMIYADSELHMWYREVRGEDAAGNATGSVIWDAVDWTYDTNAYHGFTVKSMTFEKAGNSDAITIKITLENKKLDYTYDTQKTIECFNLDSKGTVSGITVGTVYPGTTAGDAEYYEAQASAL